MPSRRVRSHLTVPATRSGAASAGISDWQLRHRGVVRLSRDTYMPRALLHDVTLRIAAVLLTAPPDAVVSHVTAATIWGLAIPLRDDDSRVHLTVATGSAGGAPLERAFYPSPFTARGTVRRLRLPLTSPPRTQRERAAPP